MWEKLVLVLHLSLLLLPDAGTRNIYFRDELPSDEKTALSGAIDKLKAAKAEIDSRTEANQPGQGSISWADLLVLAGSVAIREEWKRQKVIEHQRCPDSNRYSTFIDMSFAYIFPVMPVILPPKAQILFVAPAIP